MLRFLFRRPRTVRVPIENHNVGVQTVKFRRPSMSSFSRIILTGAITTLAIHGIRYLDPLSNYRNRDIFQEQLDEARKKNIEGKTHVLEGRQQSTQQNKPLVQDAEKIVGIPLVLRLTVPIWIRKGLLRPYEVWDPEFKEFVKLQADEKRMDGLRRQVFDSVLQAVKQAPRNHLELKVIGFKGKITGSLDIVPQLFAPPTYQVPCVWISLNRPNIEFDWRELEQDAGARIERVFRPLVAFDAASAAAKVFLYTTYAITKAKLAESFGTPNSSKSAGSQPQITLPQVLKEGNGTKTSFDDTHGVVKSSKPIFPFSPEINDGQAVRKLHQDIVSAMPYSSAIHQAATVFNLVKTARQKAAVSTNVRGICQIRGYVTFFGSRGKFKMEIIAHYLPSENVFLGAVQVKQRYIVQDYEALQSLREAVDQKRAEEAAKKTFEKETEMAKDKSLDNTSSSPSESSSKPSTSSKDEKE